MFPFRSKKKEPYFKKNKNNSITDLGNQAA